MASSAAANATAAARAPPRRPAAPTPAHLHVFASASLPRVFPAVLLAIGIVSGPDNAPLRRDIRETWLGRGSVPPQVDARFLVDMPRGARELLLAEGASDVLLLNYTGGRQRAAFTKQWVWFGWALRRYPSARFIAKCEDDVFLHPPGLLRMATSAPFNASAHAVFGLWQWFSWLPEVGCPVGFGFTGSRAEGARAAACKGAASALCYGPFPFPGASFVAFAPAVLRALLASPAAREAANASVPACDKRAFVERAKARGVNDPRIAAKFGNLLSEDVWVGYALRRWLADVPLRIFNWREPLHMDNWFSQGAVHQNTLAFHDKSKSGRTAHGAPLEPAEAAKGLPADAHFSRVRRAHVFAAARHCPPRPLASRGAGVATGHKGGLPVPPSWAFADVAAAADSADPARPCRYRKSPNAKVVTKGSVTQVGITPEQAEAPLPLSRRARRR